MSLKDLNLKQEYRTKTSNIARDFLIPILSESISYKRAVGFFSSSALLEISIGLGRLVENGGRIELIASPHLSEDDVEAIEKGYKNREELFKQRIVEQLPNPDDLSMQELDRFNLLAWLIAQGIMDIKIAFSESEKGIGIYHEKVAIVEDSEGNKVAFSGSMNESSTAMKENYEVVDVFCSWNDENNRVKSKEAGFEAIWNGYESGVSTFDFPEVKDRIVKSYLRKDPDFKLDSRIAGEESYDYAVVPIEADTEKYPILPEHITLRRYQEDAVNAWEENGYRGIFDMATGTGKTITGLAAITRLSDALEHRLGVVIVCPYQHLVEQWVEDIRSFNIEPIVGYSNSSQRDWYKRLKDAIRDQKYQVAGSEFFCFVCTNGTFATDKVQKEINKVRGNLLLVVDEAHNFGADYLQTLLTNKYDYRLALSATIERFGDDEGTQALFDFFGDRCIEYTLEEAINGRNEEPPCLTPYQYHPVIVYLEDDELSEYNKLSKEIAKAMRVDSRGRKKLTEHGKTLALKRARIVAGAKQKIEKLREVIKDYQRDNFMLVYCGATNVEVSFDEIEGVDDFEVRQIDAVTCLLGNELDMRVRKFTSRENSREREEIKEMFSDGKSLQALIAIKCLDEGVNIPMIKTAFILASTTNPREYVQRRGRLLRKDKSGNKKRAIIYDFITLPRPVGDLISHTEEEIKGEKRLVYNELVRAKEFTRLAENYSQATLVLDEIEEAYFGINGIDGYLDSEVE